MSREERAERRRRVATLTKTRLHDADSGGARIGKDEALTLVHRLTLESWMLAGFELPRYTRPETPYRFVSSRRS